MAEADDAVNEYLRRFNKRVETKKQLSHGYLYMNVCVALLFLVGASVVGAGAGHESYLC